MHSAIGENSTFVDHGIGFSLRDLLTIVFKRRKLISVFSISVFLLVVLVSLALPREYRVVATLLVNDARAEIPIAPADSQPMIINPVGEYDLNSEIEVLKSRRLIEEVLEALEIDETHRPEASRLSQLSGFGKRLFGGQDLSYVDSLVVSLQRDIEISAVRRSNVIQIAYRSTDPDWATKIVGSLTDQYLERRAERYQSDQAVAFFERQMQQAKDTLSEYEGSLEKVLDEADFTLVRGPQGSDVLAAQKALVMERVAQLEGALGDAEVEAQEQFHEVSRLQSQLATEPDRLASSNRLNQDAATEEIERGLAALRLERDSLLQDFKPDSRFVRDIDTQIRLAEERLESVRRNSGVSRTEVNPVYQELRTQLLRAEAELEGTRARV